MKNVSFCRSTPMSQYCAAVVGGNLHGDSDRVIVSGADGVGNPHGLPMMLLAFRDCR